MVYSLIYKLIEVKVIGFTQYINLFADFYSVFLESRIKKSQLYYRSLIRSAISKMNFKYIFDL